MVQICFCGRYLKNLSLKSFHISRVAYRYSGTDRNRDSFLKVPVLYRFIENWYSKAPFLSTVSFQQIRQVVIYLRHLSRDKVAQLDRCQTSNQ